jgi:DNA-binding transcriptional ArsR family regulator
MSGRPQESSGLDMMFQALADPSRRAMVERLSRGPASVSQLALPLAMSLPGVVQHLAVLEAAGLVKTQKIGRVRSCTLDTSAMGQAEQWINARRIQWQRRFERLGAYLDDIPDEPEPGENP